MGVAGTAPAAGAAEVAARDGSAEAEAWMGVGRHRACADGRVGRAGAKEAPVTLCLVETAPIREIGMVKDRTSYKVMPELKCGTAGLLETYQHAQKLIPVLRVLAVERTRRWKSTSLTGGDHGSRAGPALVRLLPPNLKVYANLTSSKSFSSATAAPRSQPPPTAWLLAHIRRSRSSRFDGASTGGTAARGRHQRRHGDERGMLFAGCRPRSAATRSPVAAAGKSLKEGTQPCRGPALALFTATAARGRLARPSHNFPAHAFAAAV